MRATPRAPAVNDRGTGLPFSGRLVARQMAALDLPTFAAFHRHAVRLRLRLRLRVRALTLTPTP